MAGSATKVTHGHRTREEPSTATRDDSPKTTLQMEKYTAHHLKVTLETLKCSWGGKKKPQLPGLQGSQVVFAGSNHPDKPFVKVLHLKQFSPNPPFTQQGDVKPLLSHTFQHLLNFAHSCCHNSMFHHCCPHPCSVVFFFCSEVPNF